MLKHRDLWRRASVTLLALATSILVAALAATTATAAPTNYNFSSGSVQLRATLEGSTESVLEGPIPVEVLLGGSFVQYDPDAGANGTLLMFELIPDMDFILDLDQSLVGLDLIEVRDSMLVEMPGATAALSPAGSFNIDTLMTGIVEGLGAVPLPPQAVSSTTSGAVGTLAVSGDTILLGLSGINLATFTSLVNPSGPQIVVKADFTFIGIVPEPGTALLLGLGLAGLSAGRRGRA